MQAQITGQQISFEYYKPHFVIDKPIRLIELFAGIGAQAKALENLGVEFEHYRICEFDRFAVTSYNAIHGTNFAPSDITRLKANDLGIVDTNQYCYILTYSFPCQDLSFAGKQAGMTKGSKTRSGLLWEVERLLIECTELPQVLLMENVTQVHSKKNSADFSKWIESLENLGYSNYYADLNAKNYGVPQNRNRTFMISILGNYYYEFPELFKLEKRLKDILETYVDEKYYLHDNVMKKFKDIKTNGNEIGYIEKGTGKHQSNTVGDDNIARTLQATDYKHIPMILQVAQLYPNSGNPQAGRIYDTDGLCCSIDTAQDGNRMPKIIENGDSIDINYPNSTTRRGRHIKGMAHTITSENNSQVVVVDDTYKNRAERQYDDCCPVLCSGRSAFKVQTEPCIAASRGRNPDNPNDRTSGIELQQRLEIKTDGTSNTLTTVQKDNLLVEPTLRIRKLTPKECFRLMTFNDADYEKCKAAGISDSQLYKQAENSIVVDVLMAIFRTMLNEKIAV